MKRVRSTGKPNPAQHSPVDVLTDVGCAVYPAHGQQFMPRQVHHLMVGEKYSQKRRGHHFTLGLRPSHQVVEPAGGLLNGTALMVGIPSSDGPRG